MWRVLCVIKKPRGRGGHSPRWAAVAKKIIIIIIYLSQLPQNRQENKQYTYKHNIEAPFYNRCCSGKAVLRTVRVYL
jgi:hypothetical protein